MADKKAGNAGALKAHETMRRRGKPPTIDETTCFGKLEKYAWKAASSAIHRADKAGLPVDEAWMLSAPDQIRRQDYRCALTGLSFNVDDENLKTKGAGGTHFAPSPDRIDPPKGYVEGNVRWVLWAVNRAKGEMPEALFIKICRAVVSRAEGSE